MKLFFIKHKPTGHFMPEPTGRMGRGGSHTEPDPNSDNARIFRTKRSAANALASWLRGKVYAHRGQSSAGPDWDSEYYEDLSIEKIESRKREDMEIVEVEFSL